MSTERQPGHPPLCVGNRRDFLAQFGAGFTSIALSGLLEADGFSAGRRSKHPSRPTRCWSVLPTPGRAKACIFLFMYGGPSQMDLFDYNRSSTAATDRPPPSSNAAAT